MGTRIFWRRAHQQRRRNRQPQRLRDFEVDHQLQLRGLLHGEVGGLGALEDLVHMDRGTAIVRGLQRPIVRQAIVDADFG